MNEHQGTLKHLEEVETKASEILTDRQEIVALDKRRNDDRVGLRALQKESNDKIWITVGPLLVKMSSKKAEELLEEDKDDYNIRKQEDVLQESLMMVPDCQRRLVKAFDELKKILETEQDLKEVEDYIEAEKVLREAEAQLPKEGNILQMC
ncbi:hypothetical protein DMN91_008031 [Ooceraea biroi]|uniref:Tubulin-specific chaperone A n=1 Tax=Ooceraea biroi TaxID=2015173 RepID=A0A3L8DGD1_OOCBI|nr:hypothetical protein DMN91_008031 [Ooceraea biroi]